MKDHLTQADNACKCMALRMDLSRTPGFKYLLILFLLLWAIIQSSTASAKPLPGNSRPVRATDFPYLILQLGMDSINTDNIMINFNNSATTAYNGHVDAVYLQGFGRVSLCALSSDNVPLAIYRLPYPKASERVGLRVQVKASGNYNLSLKSIVDIPRLFDIWLMDAYKKDSLNIRYSSSYNFSIDKKDTLSFGTKRFSLVIRQSPAFAYQLLNFTAAKVKDSTKTGREVQISWQTKNEKYYTNFDLERSIDNGKTFKSIDTMLSTAMSTYSFLDKNAGPGINIYRLKQQDVSDSIFYSPEISIDFAAVIPVVSNNIRLFPNPTGIILNLHIKSAEANSSAYNITITNSSGLVIKQELSDSADWRGNVNDLMPGIYIIRVVNYKDKSLVGTTKFLKM